MSRIQRVIILYLMAVLDICHSALVGHLLKVQKLRCLYNRLFSRF